MDNNFGKKIIQFCDEHDWNYRFIINGKENISYEPKKQLSTLPNGIEIEYTLPIESKIHRAYIATSVGIWKIIPNEDGTFLLLHHNFLKGLTNINHDLVIPHNRQVYHLQHDAKEPFVRISRLLRYIERHDKSREYELQGINKMPCRTQQQRNWKKSAKKRKNKRDANKVIKLIDKLPSFKGTSMNIND